MVAKMMDREEKTAPGKYDSREGAKGAKNK